jgi:hypothetical protein
LRRSNACTRQKINAGCAERVAVLRQKILQMGCACLVGADVNAPTYWIAHQTFGPVF